MTDQLKLFPDDNRTRSKNPPPESVPHNGTDPSKAAAEVIQPAVNGLALRVLEYIRSRGIEGATDEEQQLATGIEGNTQRPRRDKLWKAGLIRRHGKRPARSGVRVHVYVAVEFLEAWREIDQ